MRSRCSTCAPAASAWRRPGTADLRLRRRHHPPDQGGAGPRDGWKTYMAAQHGLPQDLRITDLGAHDEHRPNLYRGIRRLHRLTLRHRPLPEPMFDVAKIRDDFPILHTTASTASRWSTSTTAPPRRSPGGHRRIDPLLRNRKRQHPSRRLRAEPEADRGLRSRPATRSRRFLNAADDARDHLHPRHHRGDQSRRPELRPARSHDRRRDHPLGDGASLQHRPLADRRRAEREPSSASSR